jgi:hypothetical protein
MHLLLQPSGGRSLTEQVLEPDFRSLRSARNPPPPDGVLDLDLAHGTPRFVAFPIHLSFLFHLLYIFC